MKKDRLTVLKNINKEDKSKLHFLRCGYFSDIPYEDQSEIKEEIKSLKSMKNVVERILKIMEISQEFSTYYEDNKFQCRNGANRSALDIWRIYNNYFKPVSIFYIMRTLYELVVEYAELGTLYCHDIGKQVFFLDSGADDVFEMNELGVRFAEWRTIGL